MIIRTNIGLESHGIGTSIVNQLTQNAIGSKNAIKSSDVLLSEGGDWAPELILIQEIEVLDVERFKVGLETICRVLGEDAIAVAIISPSIGDGTIIFSPTYTGERYNFNLAYFVG
jgi:hypothetical protein